MNAAYPVPEPTPASKILTVTQLHATLATILLVTAASHHPLTDALAYLHLWCAALGFAWWYLHAATNTTTTRSPPPPPAEPPPASARERENGGCKVGDRARGDEGGPG
ncbi:896b9374-9ef9-4564-83d3-5a6a1e80895b [Thermothielavioides terrestris]|uniref:896b9374-9ef9-4564-83d3-5a6a1e80895b n=1 Tax=Thermothielavioides terrestris TaxID=2587410 RepID=A0A446B7T2_9PEZI|nr:896b9374-9ef9-4564-83d3-5a6a1e80895b [Thermothielavioides terrestris]